MANFYKDNKDLKFQLSNPLMKRIVEIKEEMTVAIAAPADPKFRI